MTGVVRRAWVSDAVEILALRMEFMAEYGTETPLACDPQRELAEDTVVALTDPDIRVFVVEENVGLSGMVIAGVIRKPKYLGVRGTITGLYVTKAHRGGRLAAVEQNRGHADFGADPQSAGALPREARTGDSSNDTDKTHGVRRWR